MSENWEQYVTNSGDEWDKYATNTTTDQVTKLTAPDVVGSVIGTGVGLGAAAGAGYGVYKLGKSVVKGIKTLGEGLGSFPKVWNVEKGANFAQQVRKAFIDAHTNKIAEFRGKLDSLTNQFPDKTVSLTEAVTNIVDNWNDFSSSTKSAIKNTPILNKLLKIKGGQPIIAGNPESISLKGTQDIINHLNTKVPTNIRANNLDLLDTINNVKGAQLDAFPEMEGIRTNYKNFIEPYKQIKNYFKFNRILKAIANKFGGAEGQIAVEKVLPQKTLKEMKGYRTASKLSEIPQDLPLVGRVLRSLGGIFTIAPQFFQALNFSKQLEEAKKKGFFKIDEFGNIIPLSREDLAI